MYFAIAFCVAIKLLAMAEWPPLYRVFLFIPATVMNFISSREYAETNGIYSFPEFILDYSCSGIHFFVILVLTNAYATGRHFSGIAFAFIVTILANIFRIALSLKVLPYSANRLWLHEVVGTAVFISFLLGYYVLRSRQENAEPV